MANLFLKDAKAYKRDIDPFKNYIEQTAFYLSKMKGKDEEYYSRVLRERLITKKDTGFNNPVVDYYERNEVGDKYPTQTNLSGYIKSVIANDEILAPTFTSYLPPKVERSLLVDFIDENKRLRNLAKKAGFKAKMLGDMETFIMKNNEQNNKKTYNNAMSGAFGSKGSVLYNPTGHSTLTSTVRTESSVGNALNEKIVSGNRHYRNLDVTLNNIIVLAKYVDKPLLSSVVSKYKLHVPTIEETIECVEKSTRPYWVDSIAFRKISSFIEKLDDLERVSIVYTSDLFHLRKHNSDFIRVFLTELSRKQTVSDNRNRTIEEIESGIHLCDEGIVNYGHQICLKEAKGIGKDYRKTSLENARIIYDTCQNVTKVVSDYLDFIKAFFLTDHLPASTAYIRSMVRQTVVLSDTDSTMFSVDDYVKWYFGELVFTDEAYGIAGGVAYLATQCVAHCLALFSANLGVEESKMFDIAMKPEYVFPVFAQTPVSKHYFTMKTVQEGNVFKEPELEIKGVHLKNSASPKSIIDPAHQRMEDILKSVARGEKISLVSEIKNVANQERSIINSVLAGEIEYFKRSKIKNPEAYTKGAEESPYWHHMFWNNVFKKHYGEIEEPIYLCIKIPTILNNRTAIQNWLASIANIELRNSLSEWLVKYNKTSLPTMYLSQDYVRAFGIPKEIKEIMDVKRIALDLTVVYRLVLETLGYCPKPDKLIMDLGY
jgi:transcriptional/translational regulatory protein YebC/TACO1